MRVDLSEWWFMGKRLVKSRSPSKKLEEDRPIVLRDYESLLLRADRLYQETMDHCSPGSKGLLFARLKKSLILVKLLQQEILTSHMSSKCGLAFDDKCHEIDSKTYISPRLRIRPTLIDLVI